ncbi:MAG: ribonuclease P protein component [Alphaproteobacteria bacterium]|nr:ribonuclease P protein component [Alphaproteobacteria bacterium]
MRPRLGRLRQRADFLRVAGTRVRQAMPGLVLQAAPMPDTAKAEAEIRLGFTASRKVGNAVARNRARRRLREAARLVLAEAGRPDTDYVLICREATLARDFEELKGDIALGLRKVGARLERAAGAPRATDGEPTS